MKIVVAPDAFKGTLTQMAAAKAMKQAIVACNPNTNVIMKPMADGGEGTFGVLLNSSFEREVPSLWVTGPLGRSVQTHIGVVNEDTVIIEVAKIIGLPLVKNEIRNPSITTTYGVGEAILFALDRGIRKFMIGLGGSATNDGGFAMLQALGARFQDRGGRDVSMYGSSLTDIHSVDLSLLDHRLKECTLDIISDVTNPLYGESGATRIFGPQKGIINDQVSLFDQAMRNYADLVLECKNSPHELAYHQGAGAAGGLGFAFLLIGGKLVSGASFIAKTIELEKNIQQASLVITGEGKSDAGTILGKAPGYVANVAKKHGVPCLLISGTIRDRPLLADNFTYVYSLVDESISKQVAMESPRKILFEKTKQIIKERIL